MSMTRGQEREIKTDLRKLIVAAIKQRERAHGLEIEDEGENDIVLRYSYKGSHYEMFQIKIRKMRIG